MKNIGVWMDKEKAYIVFISEQGEEIKTIYSNLEFYNPTGGSRTRSAKWGPQQVVHDSKYLEREKHQLKAYFNKLAGEIGNANAILLFGPAQTKEKFQKELSVNFKDIAMKVGKVMTADSMTENQIKSIVRDYFRNDNRSKT